MRHDSPHYTRCLEILKRSPLFRNVDNVLLKDMLQIFHYKTRAQGETAISPEQASDLVYIIILSNKESIMKELLKNIAYTGIGAAFLTKEKIEALKDDLVEQDKISPDEAKQFVDRLVNKSDSIKDSLDIKISQIDEEIIKQFNIPINANFADLRRQVEELQVALNKNSKS